MPLFISKVASRARTSRRGLAKAEDRPCGGLCDKPGGGHWFSLFPTAASTIPAVAENSGMPSRKRAGLRSVGRGGGGGYRRLL